MVEVQSLQVFEVQTRLGEDKFEYLPLCDLQLRFSLGTHAHPIEIDGQVDCPVGLHGQLKPSTPQLINQTGVNLQ